MEHKSYIKYLGVLINENLSWKNHLDCVITKISKTIGMIAMLRHFVPSFVLTNIYKSLISPYFTYRLVAWGNASKNYLNKIVVLQKRVLRLIYFVDKKEHAIPLFVNAKILPITFLYYEVVCKLMFDIHKDSAPSNIMKLFTRTSNIHTYNTRSSMSQFFSAKYSRLKMPKKPFHVLVSKSGMRCLVNTKICPRNLSKKETKRALLNILETEDSYKEPDDIMLKFKHSKIELNSTNSTIFFIHLETLGFFSPLQ